MDQFTDRIFTFFDKSFKKRFTICVSIPLIWSIIFLTDFYLLQDSNHRDLITKAFKITVSSNVGGTLARQNRKIGYKYITKNKLKFSTPERKLGASEIQVASSPIFNTVKSVIVKNKKIEISSGFNGISKVILLLYNFIIIISIIYTYAAKKISENARLNLLILNFLIFMLWLSIMFKFGI